MDCKVERCIKKVFAAGLCHRHYEEERRAHAPRCNVQGCEQKAERVGMCNLHYRQQRLEHAPPCIVEGCSRPQFVGGHCQTHHKRIQRYGSLDADMRAHDRGARRKHPLIHAWYGQRRVQCLAPEWHDDFWAMVTEIGDRPSPQHVLRRPDPKKPLGPGNWRWLATIQAPPTQAEYQREYRKRRPDRLRNTYLKRRYGITFDDFERMLGSQGGVCAICKKPETAKGQHGTARELAVDHCHVTGTIRGLLCSRCNTSIGNISIDDGTLENARLYLRKHRLKS